MINLKTTRELRYMRDAGKISQEALLKAGEAVRPGVSTLELDKIVRRTIEKAVIHGIPSAHEILKEGDIVSIDVGAIYEGFNGDNAWTFPCGKVSEEAQKLMDATRESLFHAIEKAVPGNRIGDIGSAVQQYVEARNYSVVREFVGHGVGAKLHEDPSVPNYGTPGRGVRLLPGMTIAIEPMVTQGSCEVKILKDGWTTVTKDGKLAAHFEHSIAITPDGPVILTSLD